MYLTRGDLRTHMGHQSSLPQSDETADFFGARDGSFYFFLFLPAVRDQVIHPDA